MLLLMLTALVVITSILETLLWKFRNSDVDFDQATHFPTPSRVESIGKI